MRRIEENACMSPWRDRSLEVAVLCTGLMICALTTPTPSGAVSVLSVCIALAVWVRIPLGQFLRKLLVACGFAMVSILPLSVDVRFHPAFGLHGDPVGIQTAILALARSMASLSVTLAFVFTTPISRTLSLLRFARVPDVLLDLLALVHREIFILDESQSRLRKALASRDGWGNARAGRRSVALGATALFVKAIERSERLEKGLASRGGSDASLCDGGAAVSMRPLALFAAVAVPMALFVWIRYAGGTLWNPN